MHIFNTAAWRFGTSFVHDQTGSIKRSPEVELQVADQAQVRQKTRHRAPNESIWQTQKGASSPDSAVLQSYMPFEGVFFHSPAVNAFAAVQGCDCEGPSQSQWTDSDRIFQQNTGEHCDISPSMSRSFLLIQCT
jgi:hypothetical protein